MLRSVVFSLLLISGLSACIDPISLPIRNEDARLVVDGQITNEAPPYTVRLTYTTGFTGSNTVDAPVLQAVVSLSDDAGRSTTFQERGPGEYETIDPAFRGEVGRSYSLTVRLNDGTTYVSQPERMPDVPTIDSISVDVVSALSNMATPYRLAYSVTTSDPATERNYYRWTAFGYTNRLSTGVPCSLGSPARCNNRCWTPVFTDQLNVFADDAINGNPIRKREVLQIPIYTIGPQLVEVQQYGLTQANYQFWKAYEDQSTRTGSIFDPLPAPITGNLINVNDPADRARGYFAVTSITRKRIRAQEYNAQRYPGLLSFISGIILPEGDCRQFYGPVPIIEPEGWR
ncbi:DUF4249 domain-containing protein [Fibrisoma montanum]|uniref:DUF4249 domain-containing protein n=1 Tax=Fibrisoma montanum TaxID=2305895 RepID=A0A418M9A2_9BACT|nr:DUF4249 domain-containing protein [Fibrisoma montanum]RIV22675.1 DUF4249 domain-containing protein [Fibrisoma montanum]